MRRVTRQRAQRLTGQRSRIFSRAGFFALQIAAAMLLTGCTVPDLEYCSDSAACPGIVGVSDSSYVCHPVRHVCIPNDQSLCNTDDDCKELALPRCNNFRCEPCVLSDNSSCAHNKQAPFCGSAPSGGTMCVACRQHLDCPSSAPICDGQVCRKCQKHSDCEGELNCEGNKRCTDSLVCMGDVDFGAEFAGQCAMNGSNGRTVYAYNDSSKSNCSDGDTRTGTDLAEPFCDLEQATKMAKMQLRTYVRVVAGGKNYPQTTSALTTEHIVYIGSPVPSRGIMTPATVEARGQTFVASNTSNVTIDEFDLLELTPNTTIVQCSSSLAPNVPNFTLRNSMVRGSTMKGSGGSAAAVELVNCQAKIYGNTIGVSTLSEAMDNSGLAHSRGLKITSNTSFTGPSFLIENNIIAGNWGMAVDLYNVERKSVIFHFNTLVYNGRDGMGTGGVNCPTTGSQQLMNSIIFANGPGSQFGMPARCTFGQLVVGVDETLTTAGLIRESPTLDTLFHLTAGSGFCVDKAQAVTGEVLPAFDLLGTKRPQGPSHDIGAFELPAAM